MKSTTRKISYNPHALQVLEFDRVREIITTFADSEESSSGISEITPCKDKNTVRALLSEVDEIMQAIRFDDPLPAMSLHSIREILPRLKVKGNNLVIEEIVAFTDNLELAHDIKQYFEQRVEKYPVISHITCEITLHNDLVKHIRKVITPDLEIADDATPNLLSIRRKFEKTKNFCSYKVLK